MSPMLLAALSAHPYPVGPLAAAVRARGGLREPLLDAMYERGLAVLTLEVGGLYFVETVTKYYVGRVAAASPTELVLADAAWVDDTGRLHEFLANGRAPGMSAEPYPDDVHVPLHMVTNATPWRHKPLRQVV